ncbi:MAG: CGNR zinc finger domain-containing protein [Actinomycetota bacterium]|nr:CGNR zinc finger domain-containing protein [Actinomycetota bacterium]
MIFAHDTEVALSAAAALVNTSREAGTGDCELLPDAASLDEFVRHWQWTGSRAHDAAELRAVQDLRPRLACLWEVQKDAAVDIVNALLRDARALPQLVKHDMWDYHLHASSPGDPLAQRMSVEAAMAMTDVIRMGELSRLRVCAGENCARVLVDLSKNRSRRYCDAGCGNRANVAAYRARRVHES